MLGCSQTTHPKERRREGRSGLVGWRQRVGARRAWPPTLERGSGQREAAVIHSQFCCPNRRRCLQPIACAATQQRGTDHRSRPPGVPTLPEPLPAPLADQPLEPWNSLRSLAPLASSGSLVTTGACPRTLSGKCSCRNLGVAGVGVDSGGTAEEKGKMLILRGYQTRDQGSLVLRKQK